ncbi:sop2 [Symbiodinium necroappetens]|uniref:Sop2 protein n=1 Tax=Symbiodinium necroappetens TaxID=1628268 RepID=A0A812Q6K9_9DINO|nr:sop2 [Symbiodinium necroappetens]
MVPATAMLLNQLPVWVAATLATWLVCWLVVSPVSCHEVPACTRHLKTYPGSWHVISCAMLLTMVMYEVMSLIATYMGAQHTQSLIPHLKSKCLPTFLLALMFGVLASAERLFSRADWTVAHVMPSPDGLTPVGRPVYTLQYMEWGINVPILLILAGYCSMGRPLQEISRPLVVTNIYVILCWAATATESAVLKWLLIAVSFAMYGWASYDMLGWCVAFERSAPMDLPARSIRPMLSSGLVLHLLLYGVVYVASTVGFISAHLERKSFFALTFGSKLAYSAAFVFIRADEYHKTLTDVLRKVSVSNVAMVSILRGSFDIILPCVLDAGGRCKLPSTHSGDMTKLEKVLGCPIAGANLKDLLAGDQDRADFSSYVRNVVRQADCPQSFNEATLSTQGSWTCKADAMPPIAQVLHSKMQCKVASGTRLDATIHLSVVPRSALSFGKERQLVAAIQFTTPTMNEAKETDVGVVGFESFQAKKSVSSGGSTQPTSDTRSNSGIVANLADLNKLGMPGMLESSEEKTNEDSASHYYGASMTDETMSHLAAFTKQDNFGRFSQAAFDARVVGVWEGTVNKALGGYRQRIEFSHDCIHANITVMGKTLEACFRMDCSKDPCHLDIEVIPAGSSCPPPAIPYIFKFEGDCLVLCGPGTSNLQRPRNFDGIGLCVMERADPCGVPMSLRHSKAPSKASELEPDPEFSRNTTEATEAPESSAQRTFNKNMPKKELDMPKRAKADMLGLMEWIEDILVACSDFGVLSPRAFA